MPATRNTAYQDRYWWSLDNLRLHARDYGEATALPGRPPILCLPGLTRNMRDFQGVAERLAGQGWRVLTVSFRGRGESGYSPDAMSYVPLTYVQDVERLLTELKLERVVAIGTSLGGIVTMMLAGADRGRLAGAVLNDVGPVIEPAGLARIRGYVGKSGTWPTWLHAARALAEQQGDIYPGYALEDWLAMAKRLCRLNAQGRIVLDYDLKIAEPFRVPGAEAGPDMWRALDALAGIPVLVVRGERSDVLGAATAAAMVERLGSGAELVTVPGVGHAPSLDEPSAVEALERLLARVATG